MKFTRRISFSAAGLLAVFFSQSSFGQNLFIRDAKVVVRPGQTMDKVNLSIRDGRITAIGKADPGPDVPVIDGNGLVVYAGFIDAFRFGAVKLPDAPAATPARDVLNQAWATMMVRNNRGNRADLDASKLLDGDALVGRVHSLGLTNALLSCGGSSFRGWTALVNLSDAKTVLQPKWAFEYSLRSGGGGGAGYPGSLMGVIALMRQTWIDAQNYDAANGDDPLLASMQPAAKGQATTVAFANTELEIFRALKMADEFGLKVVLAGGAEAYKWVDVLKARRTPVLVDFRIDSEPRSLSTEGPPPAVQAERKALWVERSQNVKRLVDAGIPIAFASVARTTDDWLAGLRDQIKQGLTADQVLSATTTSAADIFGVKDLGQVALGFRANLTILDGDFTDPKSKVKYVVVDGKLIDPNKKAEKKEAGR